MRDQIRGTREKFGTGSGGKQVTNQEKLGPAKQTRCAEAPPIRAPHGVKVRNPNVDEEEKLKDNIKAETRGRTKPRKPNGGTTQDPGTNQAGWEAVRNRVLCGGKGVKPGNPRFGGEGAGETSVKWCGNGEREIKSERSAFARDVVCRARRGRGGGGSTESAQVVTSDKESEIRRG